MPRNRHILPAFYINLFFAVGVASTACIRLLIVFNHVAQSLIRPTWYAGVAGYMVFFAYRCWITRRRRRLIEECGLVGKLERDEPLSAEEKEALQYVVLSVARSREVLNYFVIFALSFLAIAADLVLSLAGR